MERIQEQIVHPIEAPLQERVQPAPQIQNSTSISSAPPSAALTEYNALTPARADFDEWIAHMTFEGETPAERMMLRRHAQEASAERAAAELCREEEMAAPKTKKSQKRQTLV